MAATVEPSELELQILALLWARGPLTARQVLESLPDRKPRAYTSVLSVMQVMEKKGLLGHETEGNTHVYRPKVAKGRVLRTTLSRLVKQVFGGRPSAAIQSLLEETPVSAEELAEIRRMLDAMGSDKKGGSRTKA
jgi:BlaI family transcriptional regulator, penicillinase repressor